MAGANPVEPTCTGREAEEASLSDRSLLRRFRSGEEDAATALYLRYAERLRALAASQCSSELARRVDPEDIVQSVFRTFFRRATRGDYNVPDGEELWKLFLVIALNKIRAMGAFHRAAKRDVRLSAGGEALDHAAQAASTPDETAFIVLKLVIEEAVASLPEPQRRIVELRIEEHEVAEIARQTQRSKRTVERVLQQFRAKLASILEEHRTE
jgi:RNA polymerase sigma-70 factor (ECF subfamily)